MWPFNNKKKRVKICLFKKSEYNINTSGTYKLLQIKKKHPPEYILFSALLSIHMHALYRQFLHCAKGGSVGLCFSLNYTMASLGSIVVYLNGAKIYVKITFDSKCCIFVSVTFLLKCRVFNLIFNSIFFFSFCIA